MLTWRGQQQGEAPSRINGANKKVWRRLSNETQEQQQQWPSLAAAALKSEEAAAAADAPAAPTEESAPEPTAA